MIADNFLITAHLLSAIIVFIAAIIDQRTKKIPNWLNLLLFVVTVLCSLAIGVSLWNYTATLFMSFLLALPKTKYFNVGGGDLKLVLALTPLVGWVIVINAFCVSAIYLGIVYFLKKNQEIPLGAALFLAYCISISYGSLL